MLVKVAITTLMLMATTAIHAAGMMLSLQVIHVQDRHAKGEWQRKPVFQVSSVVLMMFCASLLEAALWALPYFLFGPLESMEEALYFSMVTFTTLGYGDVVLPVGWRMLAACEAANGIIMFGWTTAIVMTCIRHVYLGERVPLLEQKGQPKEK